ncbi:MAG: phage holin family protein [Plesiomonas sp.]
MSDKDPQLLQLAYILMAVMTMLGSLAKYAHSVLTGKPFRWRSFGLHMFISMFAGSMAAMCAWYFTWHPALCGAAAGWAGWAGASLITLLEDQGLALIKEKLSAFTNTPRDPE